VLAPCRAGALVHVFTTFSLTAFLTLVPAVAGVDMWFLNSSALLPYQSNLSVWISGSRIYNSVRGAYLCEDNFSPSVFAPDKHTIECDQTLTATRYVTVWRPITSLSDTSLYIHEMRVLRAVASAECACRLTSSIVAATYSTAPAAGQGFEQLIDGSFAPSSSSSMVLPTSTSTQFGAS
jgi:hypothetical protein